MSSSVSETMSTIPQVSPVERCLSSTSGIFGFALFIIGCVAAAGHMNGVVAGGCVVGLSTPMLLLAVGTIASSKNKQVVGAAIWNVIQSIALVIIGSLTITGIMTPITAGWCVIGPSLVGLSLACCCACCFACIFGGMAAANNR